MTQQRPMPLPSLSRAPPPVPVGSPPRQRTVLPHFTSSNASPNPPNSPGRALQPEDFGKTPLEKAIEDLRSVKARVTASFERMSQTQAQFELDLTETTRMMAILQTDQSYVADVYTGILHLSATQIQRCFRGHLGRRLFRQIAAVRAALRIQRVLRDFHRRRDETRKRMRMLCRKILRGLRGVRERHELTHGELLTRVGHNMQVETQWRKAMGVGDTENDLISALYRKKYVRKRLGAVFRHLFWLHSVTSYWKKLLPQQEPLGLLKSTDYDSQTEREAAIRAAAEEEGDVLDGHETEGSDPKSGSERKIVVVAPRGAGAPTISGKSAIKKLSREELRRRQKVYTQRVHEENTKRETAHAAVLERQREAERLAELQRKRQDEELRLQRLQNAQSQREDLDRRGLQAIREQQMKKDEELRKAKESTQRIAQAKKKIATEVLSTETQRMLTRQDQQTQKKKQQS
ncbi:hypothetical protein BBJ28_00006944 [Nothophytophthora sp. Chile5]|nr:hypothetical protein BBJ28_00006944 [Nothophytophthora sp. Chile5]